MKKYLQDLMNCRMEPGRNYPKEPALLPVPSVTGGKSRSIRQADKLSVICKALDMSLADLLCDKENTEQTTPTDYLIGAVKYGQMLNYSENPTPIIREEFLGTLNFWKSAMKSMIAVRQKRGSVMYQLFRTLTAIILLVINDIRFKGKRSVRLERCQGIL